MLLQLCRAAGGQVLSRRPPSTSCISNPGELEDPCVDPEYPVTIVTSNAVVSRKILAWIDEHQTRSVKWMLDCISRYQDVYL